MAVMIIELYSESVSDLEKVFKELCNSPLPEGVSFDDYEIITDLACPECDGDIRGDFVDGAWEYTCDLCRMVCDINLYESDSV